MNGLKPLPDRKASPEPQLPERLARAITLGGPISVAQFMAAANAHYYATRDPLGVAGDFVTAPEISQMFGELLGIWLADLWSRAGKPEVHYVELGPGRGTLAADALRAMAKVGLVPPVHFVETSPILLALQAERVPACIFHDDVVSLPDDRPLLIVANEFFDALPIYQMVKGADGKPVSDAEVSVLFVMPAMPAMKMAEMRNEVTLKPSGPGMYMGSGNVMMAGKWNVTVSVKQGGKEAGQKKLALTAK